MKTTSLFVLSLFALIPAISMCSQKTQVEPKVGAAKTSTSPVTILSTRIVKKPKRKERKRNTVQEFAQIAAIASSTNLESDDFQSMASEIEGSFIRN